MIWNREPLSIDFFAGLFPEKGLMMRDGWIFPLVATMVLFGGCASSGQGLFRVGRDQDLGLNRLFDQLLPLDRFVQDNQ